MKRVVVGLLCLVALLPRGEAYCQDAGEDSGGLLDLVFEVITAPVDLLSHLSGQGTASYLSTGAYPEQCVPADCAPRGSRGRTHRYSGSAYGTPATSYGIPDSRGSFADCRPRTPKNRYVSRRIVRSGDCPDCPSRRISVPDRPERGARLLSKTVVEEKQPNPKEIVVRVETKPQPKSPREIIVTVEPGKADQPTREPVVKVITNPQQTSLEETVVKVETKQRSAPAKETVIRVEIKEEPAVQTPMAPPQPVSKPEKPKKEKKKKSRGYAPCSPYGIRYY